LDGVADARCPLVVLLLGTVGLIAESNGGAGAAPRGPSVLPLAARGPISAAIGRSERAYWVRGTAAANPSQHLQLRFLNDDVVVTFGRSSLLLAPGRIDRTDGPHTSLTALWPNDLVNRRPLRRHPRPRPNRLGVGRRFHDPQDHYFCTPVRATWPGNREFDFIPIDR